MEIKISDGELNLSLTTRVLLRRMLSPLCGLDQRIGFLLRGCEEPRVMTAGAELTGVHLLNRRPPPRPYSYHIGACGVFLEEVMVRTLGESVERYAQCLAEVSGRHEIVMATHDDLVSRGEPVVSSQKLRFFSEKQYSRAAFPFQPFRQDAPIGWVKAFSLLKDSATWVPAQLVLVGYLPKRENGENWILSGVTTGSAAHTKPELALRNALLELVQIDSAMGHWFSAARAREILLDRRTEALQKIIARSYGRFKSPPKFYWLQNPDLAGMAIACVIRNESGSIPATVVGLGSDLKLEEAMYKAFLEAIGVAQLAKLNLLHGSGDRGSATSHYIDPGEIFDLDQNVHFYALPENRWLIDRKFGVSSSIRASELEQDCTLGIGGEIRLLVEHFRGTHKELFFIDLTTNDIKDLGFVVVRVWSPDTISLSLPSAPPLRHPRFTAYGGATHENPHPYP
jgi:thiazole/oxazole-forming peptide maturase SagD family component